MKLDETPTTQLINKIVKKNTLNRKIRGLKKIFKNHLNN